MEYKYKYGYLNSKLPWAGLAKWPTWSLTKARKLILYQLINYDISNKNSIIPWCSRLPLFEYLHLQKTKFILCTLWSNTLVVTKALIMFDFHWEIKIGDIGDFEAPLFWKHPIIWCRGDVARFFRCCALRDQFAETWEPQKFVKM